MRIFDQNNIEIVSPDMSLGYLVDDRMLIAHHEEVQSIAEQGHYEVIAEYPNGGKDVEWVVDVPGVEYQEAYDEYEDIYRYILYTEEELQAIEEKRNRPTQLDRIESQIAYLAMMTGNTDILEAE